MAAEVAVAQIHAARVVWKWACIRGAGNVAADGGVFRLGLGDVNLCTHWDEAEELRRDVLVETETPVSARIWLLPTGVEAVAALELHPVRHRCPGELPAFWLLTDADLASLLAVISVTVAVRAALGLLVEDTEGSLWGWCVSFSNRNRGDKEWLATFHYVGHLVGDGDFDRDVRGIGRQGCGKIVSLILSNGWWSGSRRGCVGAAGRCHESEPGQSECDESFHWLELLGSVRGPNT